MAGQKSKTRVSDVLVFAQGFICTAFLFATVIQVSGMGLQTDSQCSAAIRVCIVMYGADKIALSVFFCTRRPSAIHTLTHPDISSCWSASISFELHSSTVQGIDYTSLERF
jgi:hypothetical protein